MPAFAIDDDGGPSSGLSVTDETIDDGGPTAGEETSGGSGSGLSGDEAESPGGGGTAGTESGGGPGDDEGGISDDDGGDTSDDSDPICLSELDPESLPEGDTSCHAGLDPESLPPDTDDQGEDGETAGIESDDDGLESGLLIDPLGLSLEPSLEELPPLAPALTTPNSCGLVFNTNDGQMYAHAYNDPSYPCPGSDSLELVDASVGWAWDGDSATLTLSDFDWPLDEFAEMPGLEFQGGVTDVTVNVLGSNSISSPYNTAMLPNGANLTFTGGGSLNLSGKIGIDVSWSSILFDSGSYSLSGHFDPALYVGNGYAQVNSADLSIYGWDGPAIQLDNSSLVLLGGKVIAWSDGGTALRANQSIIEMESPAEVTAYGPVGFDLDASHMYVRSGVLDISGYEAPALTLSNASSVEMQGGEVELTSWYGAISASSSSSVTVEMPDYTWEYNDFEGTAFGVFDSGEDVFNFPTNPPASATYIHIGGSASAPEPEVCGLVFNGATGKLQTRGAGDDCSGTFSVDVDPDLWDWDPSTYTLTLNDLAWNVTGPDWGLSFIYLDQALNLIGGGDGNQITTVGGPGINVNESQTVNFSGKLQADTTYGLAGLYVNGQANFIDGTGEFNFTGLHGIYAIGGGITVSGGNLGAYTSANDSSGIVVTSATLSVNSGSLNATGAGEVSAGLSLTGNATGQSVASFTGGTVSANGSETGIRIFYGSQLTVDGASVFAYGAATGLRIDNGGTEFKSGYLEAWADTDAIGGGGTFAATADPYFWGALRHGGAFEEALVATAPVPSGPAFANNSEYFFVALRSATPLAMTNWHLEAIDLAAIETRCVIEGSLEDALIALDWYVALPGSDYSDVDLFAAGHLDDALSAIANLNHTDGDVTIEPLPWQVCVDASAVPNTDAKHIALTAGVGESQQVLSLHDVTLRDIVTGAGVQPIGAVTVTVAGLPLAGATNVQVAYIDPADQIEYIEATVAGGLVSFVTDHFSHYGVTAAASQADPIDPPFDDGNDDGVGQDRDSDHGRNDDSGNAHNEYDANTVIAGSTRNLDTSRTRLLSTGIATLPMVVAAALLALGDRLRKR